MNKKYDFSPDDFKKWIESNEEKNSQNIVKEVESKISYKKLLLKAELEDGVLEDVCHAFFHDGGTIIETNENINLIKVPCGTFRIHSKYID